MSPLPLHQLVTLKATRMQPVSPQALQYGYTSHLLRSLSFLPSIPPLHVPPPYFLFFVG